MNNSIDQQFVEFVVKSLVGKPEAVQVERRIDEKGVLLELTVDPEDLGRVIGKRGATAQSLRTLLRALGTKNDARYNLKIVDNGVGGGYSSDDNAGSAKSTSATSTNADDTDASDATDVADETEVTIERESDVVSKTRKELEELDDLDV
jgi:predicted RNA-binding protein YlqC (UPF0109 family)